MSPLWCEERIVSMPDKELGHRAAQLMGAEAGGREITDAMCLIDMNHAWELLGGLMYHGVHVAITFDKQKRPERACECYDVYVTPPDVVMLKVQKQSRLGSMIFKHEIPMLDPRAMPRIITCLFVSIVEGLDRKEGHE